MGCALVMAAALLAPGVLLLRAGWVWTGWGLILVGGVLAGGALLAGWTAGGRRGSPFSKPREVDPFAEAGGFGLILGSTPDNPKFVTKPGEAGVGLASALEEEQERFIDEVIEAASEYRGSPDRGKLKTIVATFVVVHVSLFAKGRYVADEDYQEFGLKFWDALGLNWEAGRPLRPEIRRYLKRYKEAREGAPGQNLFNWFKPFGEDLMEAIIGPPREHSMAWVTPKGPFQGFYFRMIFQVAGFFGDSETQKELATRTLEGWREFPPS